MTNREKMLKGELYLANDPELKAASKRATEFMYEYNIACKNDLEYRYQLVKGIFKKTGESFKITAPLYVDYGSNITIGENFYANFDCIFLDVNEIIIGDNVMFGPRVSLLTAAHPTDPDIRNEGYEYGLPIKIGNSVWIGGNVVVNPGVTIGDNVIVASGAVVTKNIPSNVIVGGVPAKVIREINDEDKSHWEAKKQLYFK